MKNNLTLTKYVIREFQKLKKENRIIRELLMEKSNFKEQFSVEEICAMYGIERKTFDKYRKMGLKVTQIRPNAKIYIKKTDFDKFLKTNSNGR
jgi:hypothetical protein